MTNLDHGPRFSVIIQGKYAEADPMYVRAIDIGERTLGPDHPNLAVWLGNWASLLEKQVRAYGCFEEASGDVVMYDITACLGSVVWVLY